MIYTINIIDEDGLFHTKKSNKSIEELKQNFNSIKSIVPLILIIGIKDVEFFDNTKNEWSITSREYFGNGCIFGYNVISNHNRMSEDYYYNLLNIYNNLGIKLIQYIPASKQMSEENNIGYWNFLNSIFTKIFNVTNEMIEEYYDDFLEFGESANVTFAEYFCNKIDWVDDKYSEVSKIFLAMLEIIMTDIDQSDDGQSVEFLHDILKFGI